MTERDVQRILTHPWNTRWSHRELLSVPNTNGFLAYEADLLVVSVAGYLSEIEIKVSISDLKADLKKGHGHFDSKNRVKNLYFAGPAEMKEAFFEFAPERAGIILITLPRSPKGSGSCIEVRAPKANKLARPLSFEDKYKLARLGAMRYWERFHEGKYDV